MPCCADSAKQFLMFSIFSRATWTTHDIPPFSCAPCWELTESQFSSVAQSCSTLSDPINCSTPGFPVHHQLLDIAQTHVHRVSQLMPSNHLILCFPLFLLPSIFPSIRVFSSELFLCIMWPKICGVSYKFHSCQQISESMLFKCWDLFFAHCY